MDYLKMINDGREAQVKPMRECDISDESDKRLNQDFQAVMARLNQDYRLGTSEYIQRHQPRLYRATKRIEEQLNKAWIAVRDQGQDAAGFYALLEEWDGLMREWIKLAGEGGG
jgi:uncharacterized protein YecT (DUF1311 family)